MRSSARGRFAVRCSGALCLVLGAAVVAPVALAAAPGQYSAPDWLPFRHDVNGGGINVGCTYVVLRRIVRRPPRLLGDRLSHRHRHTRLCRRCGRRHQRHRFRFRGLRKRGRDRPRQPRDEPVRPPERDRRRQRSVGRPEFPDRAGRVERRGEHAPSPLRGVRQPSIWLRRFPGSGTNEGVPGRRAGQLPPGLRLVHLEGHALGFRAGRQRWHRVRRSRWGH